MVTNRLRWVATSLALLALASAVGVGLVLRLADPLSSPVVPAEDPYTHMGLVREHMRTGNLDPIYKGNLLYPPGLHGAIGAWWAFTGLDLYETFRFGPSVFGAIGVLGVGVLLWRTQGPAAAVVGSVATAVAPEIIFRTTMMSPTALDLALLPFLFLAIVEVVRGRLGWIAVLAAIALFTLFSHPWLLLILAAAGVAFLLAWLLVPWETARAPLSVRGVAATVAVIGGCLALAFSTCAGKCGAGFRDILPIDATFGNLSAAGIAIASMLPAAIVFLGPGRRKAKVVERAQWNWVGKSLASAVLAAMCAGMTYMAFQLGIPELVDLPRMLGVPILVFAFAAVVLLPFIASPLSHLGTALFMVTYPFVIFNPFESPFWPHRTAVYLGFAMVVLAGCAAGALVHALAASYAAWRTRRAARASKAAPTIATTRSAPGALHQVQATSATHARPAPAHHAGLPVFGIVAIGIFATLAMAGTVYAQTPDGYSGGWYRLYQPCEMDALRQVAALADADPNMVLVAGDYQAKLVLASFTNNISRVWYKQSVYYGEHNSDALDKVIDSGRRVVVVVDRYLTIETPQADTDFLVEPRWHEILSECTSTATGQPRVMAYELRVDA